MTKKKLTLKESIEKSEKDFELLNLPTPERDIHYIKGAYFDSEKTGKRVKRYFEGARLILDIVKNNGDVNSQEKDYTTLITERDEILKFLAERQAIGSLTDLVGKIYKIY